MSKHFQNVIKTEMDKKMESRLSKGKAYCKAAEERFGKRFDAVKNVETYMKCIKVFLREAEGKEYDEILEKSKIQIERSKDSIMEACWEMCMEAINRDFIRYVSTGNKGTIGQRVYDSLKEQEDE